MAWASCCSAAAASARASARSSWFRADTGSSPTTSWSCDAGPEGRVIGSAPERVRHYMEIRGLGIVFIPDLFGPEAVREEMPIDLVCQLEKWTEGARVRAHRPRAADAS